MNPSLPENPAKNDYNNMSLRRPIEYSHNLRASSLGIPSFRTVNPNTINPNSISGSFHASLANANNNPIQNPNETFTGQPIVVDPDIYPTLPEEPIPDMPVPTPNLIVPPRVAPPPSNTTPNNATPNNTVPNNRTPNNTVPNNAVPNNAVPNNTAPRNAAPRNNVPPNNAITPRISPVPSNALPNRVAPVPPRVTPIPNNMTTPNGEALQSQSNCDRKPSPCQRCNEPARPNRQREQIREDMRKQAPLPSYNDNVEVPANQYHIPMGVPLMPLYGYDNCEDADKDWDYMRQMYPVCAKKIIIEIDVECDKLEYDGSCMFDEYPDKVYLGRIVDRIYDKCRHLEDNTMRRTPTPTPFQEEWEEGMEVVPYQYRDYRRPSNRGNQYNPHGRQEPWLKNLIEILLYNEMLHRRRRYRGRKRWF